MSEIFSIVSEYIEETSAVEAEFYTSLELNDGDSIDWKASTFTPSIACLTNVYEVISAEGLIKYLAVHNGDYGITEGYSWYESMKSALESLPSDHESWTYL